MDNHLNFIGALIVGCITAPSYMSDVTPSTMRDARRKFLVFLRRIIYDPSYGFDKVPDWIMTHISSAFAVLIQHTPYDDRHRLMRVMCNSVDGKTRAYSVVSDTGVKLIKDIAFKIFNAMHWEDMACTVMNPTRRTPWTPLDQPRMKRKRRPGICKRPRSTVKLTP
jgi:hypothetical protein